MVPAVGLLRRAEMETVLDYYYEAYIDHPLIASCRSTLTHAEIHNQAHVPIYIWYRAVAYPPSCIDLALLFYCNLKCPVHINKENQRSKNINKIGVNNCNIFWLVTALQGHPKGITTHDQL